jgi:O-antigen ligase
VAHSRRDRTPPADRPTTVAFAAAAALLVGVPLVWTTAVTDPFRTPQRLLALLTLGVLAAAFLAAPGVRRARSDGWTLAWAGVFAAGLLAALACPHPGLALASLVPLLLAALGWAAIRQLDEARQRRLRGLVVVAALLQAGLTVAFASPAWRPDSYRLLAGLEGRYAWIGTLGNPGWVGVFLVLPALLATALALAEPRRRAAWGLAAAALAGVVVASRTLTALAALVFGLAVLILRTLPGRRRLAAGALLFVATAALLALSPLRGRVSNAVTEVARGGWSWLASGRGAAIEVGAAMLAGHPLAGIGPGRFEASSFAFAREEQLAERARALGLVTGFGEAHNDMLQFVAEHGAIGTVLALAGLALAWRRRPPGDGVLPAPEALFAAAALLALTQFPLHHAATAAQWLVLAALALPRLPGDPAGGRQVPRWRAALAIALAAVVALVAWQRFTAERGVAQAQRLSESIRGAPRPAALQPVARVARDNLGRQLRWLPGDWRALLALGNLSIDAGEPSVARRQFEAALALAERPETRFDLGVAALLAGDRGAALDQLEIAVRLNPVLYRQVRDEETRRALRARLEATGYVARHPWAFAAD